SRDARDKVDLFNPPTGTPDLGRIEDFPRLRQVVMEVPGVEAVIPMGTDLAMVFSGNILDVRLSELREALAGGPREEARIIAAHVRSIIGLLEDPAASLEGFAARKALDEEPLVAPQDVERALSDAFWKEFEEDPEAAITFLENRITPLAMDESMLWLRYIGTDTEAFDRFFESFEIVKGQMIPPGQRGFLFSDRMYEMQVKHSVARRLDRIRELREQDRTIAGDVKTAALVDQNTRQYNEILLQLDGPSRARVEADLRDLLGAGAGEDLKALLVAFLTMDDESFDERYAFFYDRIAPHVVLYKVRMGDTLTITTVDRSGYLTNVAVKVWGTYKFAGLEKSLLAGVYNLMDLMTFRDLYGYMTEDRAREIEELRDDAGTHAVARERAEEELFDDTPSLVQQAAATGFDEFAGIDMTDGGRRYDRELMERVYSPAEIEDGVVIQAAVRLDSMERVDEALAEIQRRLDAAGLGCQVVDWRSASGMVGQFIGVIWAVLVSAIIIIFLVALV
ncbi:MAG: ABC transporter permease, partial [Deltaproteobacteria bacterium]|nr:ABC transporter permease [Deltaproteobacteria bacterium]